MSKNRPGTQVPVEVMRVTYRVPVSPDIGIDELGDMTARLLDMSFVTGVECCEHALLIKVDLESVEEFSVSYVLQLIKDKM